MKVLEKMSDSDVERWLNKTANSLVAFAAKGGYPNSARGYTLRDRYEEVKQEAIYRGLWKPFCKSRRYDENHDAVDFFA